MRQKSERMVIIWWKLESRVFVLTRLGVEMIDDGVLSSARFGRWRNAAASIGRDNTIEKETGRERSMDATGGLRAPRVGRPAADGAGEEAVGGV